MQSLGTCFVGGGLILVATARWAAAGGVDDVIVVAGIALVGIGLVAAVVGRRPDRPV